MMLKENKSSALMYKMSDIKDVDSFRSIKGLRFLRQIKKYESALDNIVNEINKSPQNWDDYQSDVNVFIESVFKLCEEYELENIYNENKVSKIKQLFIKHFRKYFRMGSYNRMVIDKPHGYVGDFEIIDAIYKNEATTIGIERCLDNYFLTTQACAATRNRKEDFKKYIEDLIRSLNGEVNILDLGSGPCREIYELLAQNIPNELHIDCLDMDRDAINYAKTLLTRYLRSHDIQFMPMNIIKLALSRSITGRFLHRYDLIFSTGLFDYLNDKIAIRLLSNLKKLLKPHGWIIISNYRDKYSNPSRFYMEWGGDWELHYRSEHRFLELFIEAGFLKHQLNLKFERQHIMQYCFAQI